MNLDRLISSQAESRKAIRAHPALMDNSPTTFYSPGGERSKARLSQREAHRHLDAYGGNETIDWVMDCVRLYADTASGAAWHFERQGQMLYNKRTDDMPEDGKLAPQELVRLMEQPNPYMDYAELLELLIIDLLLVGNAYWFKWRTNDEGKPLAIYRLAPPHVHIIPGEQGVDYYEYQAPGMKDPMRIDPKDLMHLRLPNPHSAYYGLGLIKGGGRPFDLELALADAQASYYENKADPSLIVQSERRVPRDVFQKIRQQLRARTSGTRNAGEMLVLEAGLKATSLSPNARDAAFKEISTFSRDRIFAMFRVPPPLMGFVNEGSGNNKITDSRREFDNKTMRPLLDKLQKRITAGLVAAWDLEFVIDYHYTMPEEELLKNASSLSALPGVKVKEIRRFLKPLGFEETTGDPEIDEMVLNLPGEEGTEEDTRNGFPDRPLAGEAGRPPNGENTRAFPKGTQARLPAGKAMSFEELFEFGEKAIKLEQVGNTSVGRRLSTEERPQDSLQPQRDRDVDEIAAALKAELADAVHVLERSLLDHVEGKAYRPKDLVRRLKQSEAWKAFSNMIGRTLESGATKAVSTAAIHQGNLGVMPDDDLDYEAIAREVIYRPEGIRSITNTLKEEITQKVAASIKAGATREDVERQVRESLDFWRENKAETIALTEAVHAYNEGTLTVLESAGVEDVVVSDGRDHDQPCLDADGRVWSISEARENRLEHPRCRRAFLPLT